ncbi:Maf family nucleotide pyrophosphatase [uncultured Desulfovibrio sp.]|uniref:Maf family nucleotide pyrophosphatase n=1 Tax=uncultured Desulfovibrio sp. TaxID=167968 RepID=UPI0026706E64|nr:Maf family nucleotide pyrophosphatase [uncultured Desulfovibrio sp.]
MNAVPLRPLFVLRPGIRLVLASASPRRRQFMDEWGLPYTVVRPAGVEPRPGHGESPAAYALRAATAKARAVAASADAGADGLILAADTVVALDSDILGKPADDTDALDMLRRLSGRGHEVITGVCCLFPDGSSAGFADTSAVRFHAWPDDVLRAYVRSGEPADKAGAYAIQGQGAFLVESVYGSWSTVVGLPVSRLAALLLEGGWMRPEA